MNEQEQTVRCLHHRGQWVQGVPQEDPAGWRARRALQLCRACWQRLAAARWMGPRALPDVPLVWGSLLQDDRFHAELRREGATR